MSAEQGAKFWRCDNCGALVGTWVSDLPEAPHVCPRQGPDPELVEARAALARVRALAEELDEGTTVGVIRVDVVGRILRALDGEQ